MAEINYQFRERYQEVHKPGRRMDWAKPSANDVEVDSTWTISIPTKEDIVLYNAARDLEDYFSVSMGVFVKFALNATCEKRIEYVIDPLLGEKKYQLVVEPGLIRLIGSDAKTAARAGYMLEDLMNLNEAPFVEVQNTTRNFMFSPRMVHSGYGLDIFADDYMRYIAHYGITTLLIYVRTLDKDNEYNDIIDRAAQYGLNVYAYSALFNRAYPEGEEGFKYYDALYGELFRRCPGFAGIVFVGESAEFPSRDPETTGRLYQDNRNPDGTHIVKGHSPGWWPCSDYQVFMAMIQDVITRVRPDADIILWTYNWGFRDEALRLALIDRLPKGISLQATFEMFENFEKDGVTATTVDYALCYEGPGRYFTSEVKRAHENGIRFYSMTNTGGRTWDMGTVPYEPFPYQWLKRYRAMKEAHDKWNLCGTMDSHHFGWVPSFISDFAKWMFDAPDTDADAILRRIAVRDFSEDTADTVLEAWKVGSEAITELISTNPDQYGPCRVGPGYPLLFKPGFEFDSPDYAVHGKNIICMPFYQYNKWSIGASSNDHLMATIRWYTKAQEGFDRAADILDSVIDSIHPSKQDQARRQANIFRFFATTARTAINVKYWYLGRLKLEDESVSLEEKKKAAQEMLEVGKREIENARRAIPWVQFDSALGYEPSMDYMSDEAHILTKIRVTQEQMDEVASLYLN